MHNPSLEVLKYLIEDCLCDINERDENGDTPLLLAARKNPNVEIIKYLVE